MNISKTIEGIDFNIIGIILFMLSFLGLLFENPFICKAFVSSGSVCLCISVWKAYKSYRKSKREHEKLMIKFRAALAERYKE